MNRSVFEFFLDLNKRYKEMIEQILYAAVIFITIMILMDDDSTMPDYFVFFVLGQMAYYLVVKYLLKIY